MDPLENLMKEFLGWLKDQGIDLARRASFTHRKKDEGDAELYRRSVVRLFFGLVCVLFLLVGSSLLPSMGGVKDALVLCLVALNFLFLFLLFIAGFPVVLGIEMFQEGSQLKQFTGAVLLAGLAVTFISVAVAVVPFQSSFSLFVLAILLAILGSLARVLGMKKISKWSFMALGVVMLLTFIPDVPEDVSSSLNQLADRTRVDMVEKIDCINNENDPKCPEKSAKVKKESEKEKDRCPDENKMVHVRINGDNEPLQLSKDCWTPYIYLPPGPVRYNQEDHYSFYPEGNRPVKIEKNRSRVGTMVIPKNLVDNGTQYLRFKLPPTDTVDTAELSYNAVRQTVE